MGAETIALIAAGLSAAGAGATIAGNERSRSHMEEQAQNELGRQKGFQRQAQQQFQQSADQSDVQHAMAQQQQGEQQRLAAMSATMSQPLLANNNPVDSNSQSITQQQGGQAALGQSAAAQAKLGGMSEWDLQQWIKNIRANQMLGIIGSNARNSAQVLPMELAQAQHSGDALRGVGMGLSALGALGSGYSAFLGPATATTGLGNMASVSSAAAPTGFSGLSHMYRPPAFAPQPLY